MQAVIRCNIFEMFLWATENITSDNPDYIRIAIWEKQIDLVIWFFEKFNYDHDEFIQIVIESKHSAMNFSWLYVITQTETKYSSFTSTIDLLFYKIS